MNQADIKEKRGQFHTRRNKCIARRCMLSYSTLKGTFTTPGQKNTVTSKRKQDVWASICDLVNATGSGQVRTIEQVKLLQQKNLKQKACRDNYESRYTETGNKPHRQEFTDQVLDIIGGHKSQALHGICSASEGESGPSTQEHCEPLNLTPETQWISLTPVEAKPGDAIMWSQQIQENYYLRNHHHPNPGKGMLKKKQ